MKKKKNTRNMDSHLSNHRFLQDFPPRVIKQLAECSWNANYASGRYLLREGEKADHFFLIRRGTVLVETFAPRHGPVKIQTLGAGEFLGWSWLVPPFIWHFDARALESVVVIVFDAAVLRAKCEKDHELGYQLHKRFSSLLSKRLEATRLQIADFFGAQKV